MKKIISILLLLSLIFSLSSCQEIEPKHISCEEIIDSYLDACYSLDYHMHLDTENENGIVCSILLHDPDNREQNYLYIDRYSTEEKAENAAKQLEYNIVTWLIFAISGESRWLISKNYSDIHYHSFDNYILKPLEELMKQP